MWLIGGRPCISMQERLRLFYGMQLLMQTCLWSHILRLRFPICAVGGDIMWAIFVLPNLRNVWNITGCRSRKKSRSGCRKLVCIFTWWVWIWWYWATSCSAKRVKRQCAADLQANIIWLGLVLLKATQTSYRSYQWPAWLTTITLNCNVQTSIHQNQNFWNFSAKLAKGCVAKVF